jgi:hypothetical protein
MMHCRLLLPLAGLLATTSACSSSSGSSTDGDPGDLDAQAAATSDDDADSNEASSDASTSFDSGPVEEPHEAGPATVRDAGSGTGGGSGGQRLACYEAAVGICQSAIVPPSGVASWDSNCKFQGGTTNSCPTTGLVGCCIGETNHYCYYSADYTLATAQQNCSIMNGTWSTSL